MKPKIEVERYKVTATNGTHFIKFEKLSGYGKDDKARIYSKHDETILKTTCVTKGWLRAMAEMFNAIADNLDNKPLEEIASIKSEIAELDNLIKDATDELAGVSLINRQQALEKELKNLEGK